MACRFTRCQGRLHGQVAHTGSCFGGGGRSATGLAWQNHFVRAPHQVLREPHQLLEERFRNVVRIDLVAGEEELMRSLGRTRTRLPDDRGEYRQSIRAFAMRLAARRVGDPKIFQFSGRKREAGSRVGRVSEGKRPFEQASRTG
ncbi:MAG TPA: hypothetical protein DEU95_13120 [Chloroflexi bacterium]|nr:hypothetical protein [Chloroflexota bacterium]